MPASQFNEPLPRKFCGIRQFCRVGSLQLIAATIVPRQYSALYKNPRTGRQLIEVRTANDTNAALQSLPRWIYPHGKPMRRVGSIQLIKDML